MPHQRRCLVISDWSLERAEGTKRHCAGGSLLGLQGLSVWLIWGSQVGGNKLMEQVRTIETTATVRPDGTLVATVPPDVPPGEYRAVLVLEEPATIAAPAGLDLPVHDLGPWPELSLRRVDLYDE
jgi:hypothetical protein